MPTQCNSEKFGFEGVAGRKVVGGFDGGAMTSDAGALLLRETDRAISLTRRVAACFGDGRRADRIEHSLETLVAQRIHGIALGYEDLNDHDELRHDPVLGLLSGKLEAGRADCAPLAGKSTLNRLEHAPETDAVSRYHKISHDPEKLEALFVDLFIEAHKTPPGRIILDLDATDDPLHGDQEGKFFHGYYKCYCYLPLYIFCGDHLLAAKLRPSNIDGAAGSLDEVKRIIAQIRGHWPDVEIQLRADSGFCRDELLAWCENNGVGYVFGLAKNARLKEMIASEREQAKAQFEETGKAARVFADLRYQTRNSWSRARRVIAKAEHLEKGENPRFVVTTLKPDEAAAQALYEQIYCARGDMENRIKECQLDLFADRTSAASLKANQLRLWFASLAYALVAALRRIGLAKTRLAKATAGSIRLKLLKIAALVTISCRRIKVAMVSACPYAAAFAAAFHRLRTTAD